MRARGKRNAYYGLDIAKFAAALLVVLRHAVQIKFSPGSPEYELVFCWLSNLAVPMFFSISGFLLFRKSSPPRALSFRAAGAYLLRVLRLYAVWSLLYLPFTVYFWTQDNKTGAKEFVLGYIKKFFLTSNVIQLWYLPSLIFACALVLLLLKARVPAGAVVALSLVVYAFGSLMGYGDLIGYMPGWCLDFVDAYFPVFLTTRNGFFYGFFFVALGMAMTRARLPRLKYPALAGFAVFFAAMRYEIAALGENDMILSAAPAAACLFVFLRNVRLRPRSVYRALREGSEWLFFAHAIPMYALVALESAGALSLKPWPGVAVACAAALALSAGLYALSRTGPGRFLRKLI